MNKLFQTPDDLFNFLSSKYKTTDSVDIASFGMYLGFSKGTDWHSRYPVAARDFVEEIWQENLRVIIGVGKFFPCTPNCPSCLDVYRQRLTNLEVTAEKLRLNIRYSASFHMKMYRVGSTFICGGINLGVSSWTDTSVLITDKQTKIQLQSAFDIAWVAAEHSVQPYRI